ncbi:unnamed protein product [Rotaria socialis]|uniref:RCC1-like domain-containing protein n=1 Tax=Rotaria socialis TaxID=392032 RepID=A0A818RQ40_9BILA|nr:unnamed protein product [Rotaria socialis]
MANNENEKEAAQVYLLGKTYLANSQGQFYIKNDPIVDMAAGDRHTIIVTESGRAFAFGDNSSGQLGLGHTNNVEKVSCIKSLKFGDTGEKVILVACGRESSLVATNRGSLYAFGSNIRSQLGMKSSDSTSTHHTPVKIESFRGKMVWKQIAMGAEHACALTDDGIVYVWGANDDGQCGQSSKVETVPTPKELRLDSSINAISCGYYHTALVDENGRLLLFGNNDDRQLGRSMPDKFAGPMPVSIPGKVKAVACGNQHTVVLTANGEVLVSGHGDRGQLGLGPKLVSAETFETIEDSPKHITAIAAGEAHTAVRTARGDLYVCGDGKHGKLGSSIHTNEFQLCIVDRFKTYNVSKVVCGGCQTIVLAQKESTERQQASESDADIGNATLSITQREKSRARSMRNKNMFDRSSAAGDSIDTTLRQTKPPGITNHLRVEADEDKSDKELSESSKSYTFNQTHTLTNGKFRPAQSPGLNRTSLHSNDGDSKPLKTGVLDRTARLNQDVDDLKPLKTGALDRTVRLNQDADDLKPIKTGAFDRTVRLNQDTNDLKPLKTGALDRTVRLSQDVDDLKTPNNRFSSNDKSPVRNTRFEQTNPQPVRKKQDSEEEKSSSDEPTPSRSFAKKPERQSPPIKSDRRTSPVSRRRDDSDSDDNRLKRPSPIKAPMSETLNRKSRPQNRSNNDDNDEDDDDDDDDDDNDDEEEDDDDNQRLSSRHTRKQPPPTAARRSSLPQQSRSGAPMSSARDGNQTIGGKPVDGTRASFRGPATKTLAKPNTTTSNADTSKKQTSPAEQPGFFARLFGSKSSSNPPPPPQPAKAPTPGTNTNSRACSIIYGNGTFEIQRTYPTGSSPYFVTVGDFNNDTLRDIIVANQDSNDVSILLEYEDGSFRNKILYSTGSHPYDVTLSDFNNDKQLDIVVASRRDNSMGVVLGYGSGLLQTKSDLVITSWTSSDVNGHFESINIGFVNHSALTTGIGHDQKRLCLMILTINKQMDIAVVNMGSCFGYGNLSLFSPVILSTGSRPTSITVGYFNNYSRLDIVVTDYVSGSVDIFLGYDNGSYTTPTRYSVGISSLS